ncbi:MAG: PDZ domain-containing protein [Bacteroidetes bacterium]|nr:PDZ domain-containing protein [Bacteroidota bacterium]
MQKLSIYLLILLMHVVLMASGNEGYLGLSIKSYELESKHGLRVINVFDDGAALVAGIKENDFIVQVNGYYVTTPTELKNILQPFQWGDEVLITLIRDGELIHQAIVLGHQKNIKTYEIIKSHQLGNMETWYFKDNTTIILKEGRPQSITKKINGSKETIELDNETDYEQLPQNFLDLSDKLFVIEKTKAGQTEKNSTANNIVVIKEIVDVERTNQALEALNFEEFKIVPNPNNGNFDLRLKADGLNSELQWTVYDLQGRNMAHGTEAIVDGQLEKHIVISNMAAGNYLFYIKSGNQRISQQFIVE